jgi:hypothetical protein
MPEQRTKANHPTPRQQKSCNNIYLPRIRGKHRLRIHPHLPQEHSNDDDPAFEHQLHIAVLLRCIEPTFRAT